MNYTYNDFKDKTPEGIIKEMEEGFLKIALYFQTTLGIPVEVFKEWAEGEILKDRPSQLLFYMNFRNKHPKLFK